MLKITFILLIIGLIIFHFTKRAYKADLKYKRPYKERKHSQKKKEFQLELPQPSIPSSFSTAYSQGTESSCSPI